MNRISLVPVALSLMVFAGCGDNPRTTTGARTSPTQATPPTAATSTAPATPRAAESGVTVSHEALGADNRFRARGRSWRSCGATVYNSKSGYDLYGVAVSGPVGCTAATAVMSALARQVQRREAAGEDCFPGYCLAAAPRRTTVSGYRCDATDHGDVSILLSIVCRHGDRYVSAGAADDE